MLQKCLFFRQIFKSSNYVLIGLLFGLLLLFASAIVNQAYVQAQALGIVETEGLLLNVREGPGSDYGILYQLDDQTYVQILGTDSTGEWYEIRFDDESGRGGWVFASYVYQYPESALESSEDITEADTTDDVAPIETPTASQEEIIVTVTARAELAATEIAKILGTATALALETTIAEADEVVLEATVTARAEIAATEIAKIEATATMAEADEPTPTPEPTEVLDTAAQVDVEATAEAKNIRAATVVARAQIASTEIAKIHATATAMAAMDESEPAVIEEAVDDGNEVDESVEQEAEESEPEPAMIVEPTTETVDDAADDGVNLEEAADDGDEADESLEQDIGESESESAISSESATSNDITDDNSDIEETTEVVMPVESEPAETALVEEVSVETSSVGVSAVTKVDRMNIYSGPGTHYTMLATVLAGATFDVVALDATGLWYQVEAEGMTEQAWVYSALVQTSGDPNTLPQFLEPIPTQVPQATPTQSAAASPDVQPTPTLRPMMEASDPTTFKAASGRLQVVEFFGFW